MRNWGKASPPSLALFLPSVVSPRPTASHSHHHPLTLYLKPWASTEPNGYDCQSSLCRTKKQDRMGHSKLLCPHSLDNWVPRQPHFISWALQRPGLWSWTCVAKGERTPQLLAKDCPYTPKNWNLSWPLRGTKKEYSWWKPQLERETQPSDQLATPELLITETGRWVSYWAWDWWLVLQKHTRILHLVTQDKS